MSKVVKAINVMVATPEKISSVIKGEHASEVFFIYDKKHKWSIRTGEGSSYFLSYYPEDVDISFLAGIPDEEWDQVSPREVRYSSKELGTREAYQSLEELYTIVSEKLFGMDEVLDDIIDNDPIPF